MSPLPERQNVITSLKLLDFIYKSIVLQFYLLSMVETIPKIQFLVQLNTKMMKDFLFTRSTQTSNEFAVSFQCKS